MRIKILRFLAAMVLVLGVSNPAFAHKVNLFCYVEDGVLKGEGYYSGGRASQNAKIEVYSLTDNSLIAETKTNDKGEFSIELDNAGSVKVVMNSGQGHRGEFIVEQEADIPVERVESNNDRAIPECNVQYLIDQKIRPLEERITLLEKQQSEPNAVSIIGGLGLIIGFFSLIYFLKKRKHAL